MSIAAFILSLLGGLFALFQGGCVCAGGGAFAQYDSEMASLGAGGFLIVIAAVTGFVGGAMAFTKKFRAKIILGASSGLCLLAMLTGFTDGFIYCLIYGVAAVLAHLDTAGQSPSHEADSRPAKINISIDFRFIVQRLKDFFARDCHVNPKDWRENPLNKYLGKYATAERTRFAYIGAVALPYHMYNPVFWLGCFLKYKKYEHADKILFAGILSTLTMAKYIDANYLFFLDYLPYSMLELMREMTGIEYLLLFGLQVLMLYITEKSLDGDERFSFNRIRDRWPAWIILLTFSFTWMLPLVKFVDDWNYVLAVSTIISFVLGFFAICSFGYLNRKWVAEEHSVSEKPVSPENAVSAPAKTDKPESIKDMSKKGFDLLKESDFEQAKQIFDQILAKNPRSATAYVGKLMSLLKAKNANELVALPIQLEEEELFQKAMTYATPKTKELLSKYIQINNKKNSRRFKS